MAVDVQHAVEDDEAELNVSINTTPLVDVMLVLLIIFMVTAPLMNLGVDIQLPQSKARSIQNDKEPAVVSVDKDGKLFLTLGPAQREPIEPQVEHGLNSVHQEVSLSLLRSDASTASLQAQVAALREHLDRELRAHERRAEVHEDEHAVVGHRALDRRPHALGVGAQRPRLLHSPGRLERQLLAAHLACEHHHTLGQLAAVGDDDEPDHYAFASSP